MGLGGKTTTLDVKILKAHTHTARTAYWCLCAMLGRQTCRQLKFMIKNKNRIDYLK